MENQKKKKYMLPLIIALAVLVCAAAAIAALTLGPGEQTEPTDPVSAPTEEMQTAATETAEVKENLLELETQRRRDERMVLITNLGELSYPYAFSDVIEVSMASNQNSGSMVFSVKLGETTRNIYLLTFNHGDGDYLGTFILEDGSVVEVRGGLSEFPKELSEQDALTFAVAQETFNDVLASLQENENYIPVH